MKAELIADLYRQRWQVELLFKWIKKHLRIKAFLGTSENAVKTQIWIAACTYVLIAIVKKRLHLPHSLYEILQILSLTMFETTSITQLLTQPRLIQRAILSLSNSLSSEERWDTTALTLEITLCAIARKGLVSTLVVMRRSIETFDGLFSGETSRSKE